MRRRGTGLWRGYWFDNRGHRICRVRRAELGEAYRLYRLGTVMGLTDAVGSAGPKDAADGVAARSGAPPTAMRMGASPRFERHPVEPNPFHEEGL